MKIILQRVNSAKMFVNDKFMSEIKKGIVAYIGITHEDGLKEIEYCIDKLIHLRIFDDENGKLNLSLEDINGELLVVSNFTIYGNTSAEKAKEVYDIFLLKLSEKGINYQTGQFQQYMRIISESDGPVNLIIET